jgi:hypothetical protein
MDRVIREAIEIELHPNKEDVFSLSRAWKLASEYSSFTVHMSFLQQHLTLPFTPQHMN